MTFFNHNKSIIKNYWDELTKTNMNIVPKYFNVSIKTDSFLQKLEIIKNNMYIVNFDERKEHVSNIILILFNDEIEFIFNNRKIIRNGKIVSFSSFELFNWMKKNNVKKYMLFKYSIMIRLREIAYCKFSGNRIKNEISNVIFKFLFNDFIRL